MMNWRAGWTADCFVVDAGLLSLTVVCADVVGELVCADVVGEPA